MTPKGFDGQLYCAVNPYQVYTSEVASNCIPFCLSLLSALPSSILQPSFTSRSRLHKPPLSHPPKANSANHAFSHKKLVIHFFWQSDTFENQAHLINLVGEENITVK